MEEALDAIEMKRGNVNDEYGHNKCCPTAINHEDYVSSIGLNKIDPLKPEYDEIDYGQTSMPKVNIIDDI